MSWERVRRIIIKEFIQIRREPRLLRVLIIMPLFQLVAFGYAVTFDVRNVPVLVYDESYTPASRTIVAAFTNSGYFALAGYANRPQDITDALDRGAAQMALVFPRDFNRQLARGNSGAVQVIIDGSDPGSTRAIMGYVSSILQAQGQQILVARLHKRGMGAGATLPQLVPELRAWYNPDLRSVNFMVPGVIALIMLVVTMSMTSLAIVREREVGTLEQIVVTPIRPSELLIGKMAPFAVVGMADVLLVIVVARFWFGVPLAGSALLLLALSLLFMANGLGLGLLISTVSRTQQQSTMSTFFIMMPSILLSGFMFPITNMPVVIQWATYLIPLRYFLVIVRGIFLKGNGLAILWPQVVGLAVLAVLIMALAIMRFHKRLD